MILGYLGIKSLTLSRGISPLLIEFSMTYKNLLLELAFPLGVAYVELIAYLLL